MTAASPDSKFLLRPQFPPLGFQEAGKGPKDRELLGGRYCPTARCPLRRSPCVGLSGMRELKVESPDGTRRLKEGQGDSAEV